MTDPITTVVTDVKAEAVKAETAVVSWWTRVKPWLSHMAAVISGYIAANVSAVSSVVAALIHKL